MPWLRFVKTSCWRAGVSSCSALLASVLAACGTQLPGVVSANGYASSRYALGVSKGYDAPAAAGLMPEGWKLDNFNGDDPKEGAAYQTIVGVDADRDGDVDWTSVEPAFEVSFEHLHHGGEVWLSAVPVADELANKDLHVLTADYLEALAGGEYENVQLQPGRRTTVEKRFASALLSAAPCQLAAHECEAVTIELANVDQLKLDPTYRSHKLMVVITRTSFAYTPRGRRRVRSSPVYLFAGYANQPSQFEAGLQDFLGLLRHVEIAGQHGFKTTAAAAAIAVPAPVAPAAAPAPSPTPTPAAP